MKKRKILAVITSVLVLLIVVPLLSLLLITGTETGSGMLLGFVVKRLDSQGISLEWNDLQGRLISGLTFTDLIFSLENETTQLDFQTDSLETGWVLSALFKKHVHISRILVGESTLSLISAESADQNETPAELQSLLAPVFNLPVSFQLDSFAIEKLGMSLNGSTSELTLDNFDLKLDQQSIRSDSLAFSWQTLTMRLNEFILDSEWNTAADLAWLFGTEQQDFEGTLNLDGKLEALEISHELISPLTISSLGTVSGLEVMAPRIDFEHRGQVLAGSVPGVPDLAINDFLLNTAGTMEDLQLNLLSELRYMRPGEFTLAMQAHLLGSELQLDMLEVNHAATETLVSATGTYNIESGLADLLWMLQAEEIPELPEDFQLSGLNASGAVAAELTEIINVSGTINDMTAILNGYALELNANGNYQDGNLSDLDVVVLQAGNSLNVSGGIAEIADLNFDLDLPDPSALLQTLAGNLSISGSVTGNREALEVLLEGGSDGFSLTQGDSRVSLESLLIEGNISQTATELTLDISGLDTGIEAVLPTELLVELSGSPEAHTFGIEAAGESINILLNGSGGWLAPQWQGRLAIAEFSGYYGNWSMPDEVTISASQQAASLGELCLMLAGQATSVCSTADWQQATGVSAQARLEALPLIWLTTQNTLDLLSRPELSSLFAARPDVLIEALPAEGVLPAGSYLEGMLGANVNFDSGTGLAASLDPVDLILGLAEQPESEQQTLAPIVQEYLFNINLLDLNYVNGNLSTSTDLDLLYEESGLMTRGKLAGLFALDEQSNLNGEFSLEIPTLGWLQGLVPQLNESKGTVMATAVIRGNLERPLINSDIQIRDAGVNLPDLGITVKDFTMDIASDDNNNFSFNGSLISGQGQLALEGEMSSPFIDERALWLTISGEQAELMNLPDRTLIISPDLRLDMNSELTAVSGTVTVPRFTLALDQLELAPGRVNVSQDAIVIRENPVKEEKPSGPLSAPLKVDVAVTLGDQIHFTGYGLDLSLTGQMEVAQLPNRPMQAFGEINVTEGGYEMYGQSLTISNGRLLFIGNPANPALDIRAIREVKESTVGVKIGGTLNNMRSQLFSTPVLPEAEILAMLITGKSFNRVDESEGTSMLAAIANLGIEKGQGITDSVSSALGIDSLSVSAGKNLSDSSVGIGKYLTPDLFMEYKIGLVDSESVLSMIYSLTERLSLEVESGISQSIDLTYTVEK